MAILSTVETSETEITITVVVEKPRTTPADVDADAHAHAHADVDADAVSKLMQLTLGGIGVGTFSAGSTGAAYKDQLLAGAHGRAYEVVFLVSLTVAYLMSVGEMLVAARWVSLDGATTKKITFISLLLLVVLVAFSLLSYYLPNNH